MIGQFAYWADFQHEKSTLQRFQRLQRLQRFKRLKRLNVQSTSS